MMIDKENLPKDVLDLRGDSIRVAGRRYEQRVVAIEVDVHGKLLVLETLDDDWREWTARISWHPDAEGDLQPVKIRWEEQHVYTA